MHEPKFGKPIGSIKLGQKCADTARLVNRVGDSTTAVRGVQQAQDIFDALMGRLAVSSKPLANASSSGADARVRMSQAARPDDDLDLLWDPAFAKQGDKEHGPKRAGPTPGQLPTPKKLKPTGTSKRHQELDMSEQALFEGNTASGSLAVERVF